MVEKLTFNSLTIAVVDIIAVNMLIETSVTLCDKTSYFRVAFYCPQHKVHLCNDDA